MLPPLHQVAPVDSPIPTHTAIECRGRYSAVLGVFVFIAIWPVTGLVFFNTNHLVGITLGFCEFFSYTVGKSWGECVLGIVWS